MSGRYAIRLAAEDDVDGWRDAARRLDQAGVTPDRIDWAVGEDVRDLFAEDRRDADTLALASRPVPAAFVALAEKVALHSDADRFHLLYRLLFRLRTEPHLLSIVSDVDIARAHRLAKEVHRDIHKMKAFVRFRLVAEEGTEEEYAAWFEPSHHIIRAVAPFFMRRFAGMLWSIFTPRGSAYWNRQELTFGPAVSREHAPSEDSFEEFWRTYYASIFNPARLMPKAMQAHMPKKYWKNLPEASLIAPLIREAEARARQMVAAAPTVPPRARPARVADAPPQERALTLEELRRSLCACTRCPLHGPATQVVAGEGQSGAPLMIIGEQPGDEEDLAGRPFIGPAGKVFATALERIGVDRSACYITNAVKHFKFEPRGKRRIHQKPNAGEVTACNWWLEQEIGIVRPRVILAMGATAIKAVTGMDVRLADVRGHMIAERNGAFVYASVHPSYLLRLQSEEEKRAQWQLFLSDLRIAAGASGAPKPLKSRDSAPFMI